MTSIVLTTLNARYSHCAFGLRYLQANMQELKEKSRILEFTIAQNPRDIVEALLAENPRVIGFGVYIWNVTETREVVSLLKRLRPEIRVVLGGPEVSFETSEQEICRLADLTIQGEADFLFRNLCRAYLADGSWPTKKWISGPLPDVASIKLPYSLYTDSDVKNRILYVEASRGCPYKCEYCLSSLDKSVRSFDLGRFLGEMEKLIARGARQFKFVDRTFNLSISTSTRILEFFLERIELGLFLHFEMVPDRLPDELKSLIRRFPPGSLQFEIGIQTWNPEVARLVSRRQDYGKIRQNFDFLTAEKGVHLHADLIAGLPGETLESFVAGFDAVAALGPDEIQVGILKRLRGTPIIRHDQEWKMVYQDSPPYTVISTRTMSFAALQDINRFAHFWNLIANSGNFPGTLALIRALSSRRPEPSLYREFEELVRFLSRRHPQGHGVALIHLLESVWNHLKERDGVEVEELRQVMLSDYTGRIKRDIPVFLRPVFQGPDDSARRTASDGARAGAANHSDRGSSDRSGATPRRQQRHLKSAAHLPPM